MPTRFIGGVLSAQPQRSSQFLSRASTGTYFDSTGVMRTAPVNQPRLNYELVGGAWTNPQVLIEPASTNICLYSQDFTNAVWATSGNTPTRTANFAVAPDGTTTATRIQLDRTTGNNWSEVMQRLTLSTNPAIKPGVLYTFSVWLKANSGTPTISYVYNNDYSTGGSGTGTPYGLATLDSTWRRYTSTFVTTTTITSGIGINLIIWANLAATSTTADILAWGAQIEQGSLTSYIPTTNVAVTRSEDRVASMGSGIYDLQDLYQNRDDNNYTTTSFTTVGETYWTAPEGVNNVEVLVVAGGGSGGTADDGGGGGGAGGLIYNPAYNVIPGKVYVITVGAGGLGVQGLPGTGLGNNGENSRFDQLVAIGGGGGGGRTGTGGIMPGSSGGSGGGGGQRNNSIPGSGIVGQGYPGGSASTVDSGGGGGGAGMAGQSAPTSTIGGSGGAGLYFQQFSNFGASGYFSGGGGGSGIPSGPGGLGGGGAGAASPVVGGSNGIANTGGGGGASNSHTINSGNGGSGIVILRYRRQNTKQQSAGNLATVMQRFTRTDSIYTWFTPEGVNKIELLVVSGGGGGGYGRDHTNLGSYGAGGGGAGGVIYNNALTVNQGSGYQINVGLGGAGGQGTTGAANQGSNGSDSWFYTQQPLGGGGGGGVSNSGTYQSGKNGGSGGGVAAWGTITGVPGTGYSSQGNGGGTALTTSGSIGETGGGGGGAGSPGQNASLIKGGDGGTGLAFAITGNVEYYAGGGGGGADLSTTYPGRGGLGGGGSACLGSSVGGIFPGEPGAPNTGGGGGAGSAATVGGTGGSGVVVIRYQVPNVATFIESGSWTCPSGVYSVQALIVAGGGGASGSGTGGGGGGGVVYSSSISVIPGITYPVIVGQGGICTGASVQATNGQNSSFANIIAIGGGAGGYRSAGKDGGSGGGGGSWSGGQHGGGSATYGQGNIGGAGNGTSYYCGGGGGAGQIGASAVNGSSVGSGGNGLPFSISGTSTYYGGGGGAGGQNVSGSIVGANGGLGGGGQGSQSNGALGTSGTANTGGGSGSGWAGSIDTIGGNGGSGIVIIRWN